MRGIARHLPLWTALLLPACQDPSSAGLPSMATGAADPAPTLAPTLAAFLVPPPPASVALPLSPRASDALAESLHWAKVAAQSAPEHPTQTRTVAGTFLLVAGDPGASASLDAAASLTQQVHDALYAGPFRHHPEVATTVWLYSSKKTAVPGLALHADEGLDPGTIGVYSDHQHAIVTRLDAGGLGSLAHEIAHPLAVADMPLGPVWALEGIPALLEVAAFTPTGIHGKAHFRLQTLRDALASKDPTMPGRLRLDALMSLRPGEFYDDEDGLLPLHYAMAREAVRWLDARGQLWDVYHAMRDTIVDDPTGEKAFTRVVGTSPAHATAEWIAWLKSPEAEADPK